MKTKDVYQVKISLKGAKTPIWRRLLVPANMPLGDFHKVIQTAFNWTNTHLHQFIKGKDYYLKKGTFDDFGDDFDFLPSGFGIKLNKTHDYRKFVLKDLLKKEKEKLLYKYDFGDSWMHEIVLEKILTDYTEDDFAETHRRQKQCLPRRLWRNLRLYGTARNMGRAGASRRGIYGVLSGLQLCLL